ncbi:MAG: formate dehydrogenase subunit gamma [Syntrophothermus sp.]
MTEQKAEGKTNSVPMFVERFNKHQRYQHLLLMISVTMLMITGFAIKFGHSAYATFVVAIFGSFRNLFNVHLFMAVVMIITAVYHLVYLIFGWRYYGVSWAMVPTLKDLTDALQHARYLLGLSKERPRYGRYSYLEKIEYLAVFWGIPVIGISGLTLWFPDIAARFVPLWVIDAMRIVHSNEALLCLFAIVLGHVFWEHMNPGVFPTSSVWINGKISLAHMAEEHPLEYEQLVKEYAAKGIKIEKPEHGHGRFIHSRPLMIAELIAYILIFGWLFWVFVPKLFV